MAIADTKDISQFIYHSERGVKYRCRNYLKLLRSNHVKISIPEKGDPPENVVLERVNGILSAEHLSHVCNATNIQNYFFFIQPKTSPPPPEIGTSYPKESSQSLII